MSLTTIYRPTSVEISITIRNRETDALVDPSSTLALTIVDADGTTTTKAIGDLTHDGTGLYSYVHLFSSSAAAGECVITASADAGVTASAITNITRIRIK